MKYIITFTILSLSFFNNYAQNGSLKVINDFKEQYIGSLDNQHLFFLPDKKTNQSKEIKIYDENMSFVKKVKTPFILNCVACADAMKSGTSIDSVQVETYYDMLLVRRVISKSSGKMKSYSHDEISLYSLDDLTKPKFQQKIKRLPNFPDMLATTYKKYSSYSYTNFNTAHKYVSEDKIAYLYSTSFDGTKEPEKLGYSDMDNLDNKYLVVMDMQLNVLFEGFIEISVKDEKVINFYTEGNEVIIQTEQDGKIGLSSKEIKEKLYHFTIQNNSKISKQEIVIGKKYYSTIDIALSPDKKKIVGKYYYIETGDFKNGMMGAKMDGEGLFIYSLITSKIEQKKEFPFSKPKLVFSERLLPFWIGDNIITKMLTTKEFDFKIRTSNVAPRIFDIAIFDINLEIKDRKSISYSVHDMVISSGLINFTTLYNRKNEELNILYMNTPLKEKDELEVDDSEKGSHIFHLKYKNGAFIESKISIPDELKYKKQTKIYGRYYQRANYLSLPRESYDLTNTQKSFISTPFINGIETISLFRFE